MPHNFTDQEGLAELSQQLSEAEHLLLIGPHCANQTWELAVPGAEESGERRAHAGPLQNTGEKCGPELGARARMEEHGHVQSSFGHPCATLDRPHQFQLPSRQNGVTAGQQWRSSPGSEVRLVSGSGFKRWLCHPPARH